MIIQSGSIGMNSSRSYAAAASTSTSLSIWGARSNTTLSSVRSFAASEQSGNTLLSFSNGNDSFSDSMERLRDRYRETQSISNNRINNAINSVQQMHAQIFSYLLYWLFGGQMPSADGSQLTTENSNLTQQFGGTYDSESIFTETESTTFSTTGTVVTADGREISFHLDVGMSRTFTSYATEHWNFGAPKMTDPLIINLGSNVAEVSDQKFYFDLDADGHEEYISMLTGDSGYLALDKNGDGKINDGSELFGTSNGDGFADLAQYDSDGNGWIDENDPIFNQLLIWKKNADGTDHLCGIGEAGIGAIYLGSSETQFSLNSQRDNSTNAQIRQTGIFLYENGGVGTIQHVDMAQLELAR